MRDGGIRGVVIDTTGLARLERVERHRDHLRGGACPCARIARQCIKWGLGPAEFLAGIPGTLGGALAMNAGAFGGETWPRVRSVDVVRSRAAIATDAATRANTRYGYRHVVPPAAGEYFLAATLEFETRPGHHRGGDARAARASARKRSPSASGAAARRSRNPPGDHAARLIEAAGLKGLRIGDIMVSPKHANFLVNAGNATAADVETLVAHIQARVREKSRRRARPRNSASAGEAR